MATICYNQIMRFGITRRQIKPNKPTRTGIVVRVFPGNTQSWLQNHERNHLGMTRENHHGLWTLLFSNNMAMAF